MTWKNSKNDIQVNGNLLCYKTSVKKIIEFENFYSTYTRKERDSEQYNCV